MSTWTFEKTFRLVGTSYLWLCAVTAPAAAFIAWLVATIPSGIFLDSLNGALPFAVIFIVIFAVIALVGACVSLPFSYMLSLVMEPVRSRPAHTFAHAILAGILAAVSMQLVFLVAGGTGWSWLYPLLVAAPAGVAAAIARWRLDREKKSTPAEVVEAAA
ncbi:hypothetical protein ACWGJ9_09195 [Curtobacterium citreum]